MPTTQLLQLVNRIDAACPYFKANIPVQGIYHVFLPGVYAPCTATEQREAFRLACPGQIIGFSKRVERVA